MLAAVNSTKFASLPGRVEAPPGGVAGTEDMLPGRSERCARRRSVPPSGKGERDALAESGLWVKRAAESPPRSTYGNRMEGGRAMYVRA